MKPQMRVCLAVLVLGLLSAGPARAQRIYVSAYGAAASNSEIEQVRQARGLGVAVDVRMELARFRLELRGLTTSLGADFSIQPDYAFHELQILGTYAAWTAVAVQVGIGRRFTAPDFAAQEVGFVSAGALAETRLTSLARIGARFSYLPFTRFSGGGGSDFAAELGLRLGIGRGTGRFEGIAEYTYQRIDRTVNGNAAPIRFSVARVGVGTRF